MHSLKSLKKKLDIKMHSHIFINNKRTMNRNRLCSAMFTRLHIMMWNDNPETPLYTLV